MTSIRTSYTAQVYPHLRIISKDQVQDIHLATLEVLERTGVRVMQEEALHLLREAGALVDGDLVKIPAFMVEDSLRVTPPQVVLANRKGERCMFLGSNRSYFGTGSDTPIVLDPYTYEHRKAVKEDIAKAAILCDHLPNIDFVMSMGLPSDVPAAVQDRHEFHAMLSNTKKPILFTAWDKNGLSDIIRMAGIAVGGEDNLRRNPFIALYNEPISPLQHTNDSLDKLLLSVEKGIPVIYAPGILGGAAGPVTIAGTVVVANAELLSGIVIAQLKQKGAALIYGGGNTIMDMLATTSAYASPEHLLNQCVMAEMARFYKLPIWGTGGCTDACALDEQAAFEAASTLLLPTLGGVNLIHDVGFMGHGMIASWELILLCNEMIGFVDRIARGVRVDNESLAVDVIDKVGPGGNFLIDDHTLNNFREEIWQPRLLSRDSFDDWLDKGKITQRTRLNQEVKRILKEHSPEPLPTENAKEIGYVLEQAEAILDQS